MRRWAVALGCGALALGARPAVPCELEDPAIALRAGPPPVKPGEVAVARGLPAVRRVRAGGVAALDGVGHGAAGGALAGKTIYVSAGHGWVWRPALAAWRTQRGNTHGMVEDFISIETVDQYLLQYLINMGAYVVTVREADLTAELDIVDDSETAAFAIAGTAAVTRADAGYARLAFPLVADDNPFAAGDSAVIETSAQETARATWVFDVPATGAYNVYVGYVQDPSRASDAHYVVHHAGGEARFRVDQRRHGSTWVLLGRFWFEAGTAPELGAVSLVNDSADAGATVSADVVRLGGGSAMVDRGGGVNGRPMFEHGARYYAQLAGAPATVYDYSTEDGNDDVGTRSRFSAWDHPDGEDAVYVAWHTNAPDPARGTVSFAYGPSAYGPLSEFSGVPGSLELMDAVHTELVADFRAAWQPDWQDRGQHTAYFGEVNPNHNPEMPAVLVEVAFHDTAADADALRDARFRRVAARAIAHGIARYFAARDGATLVLPPEPPAAPRATQAGPGALAFAWDPPPQDPAGGDPAAGYRVYLSRDGRAFDDGRPADGTSLIVDAAPGEVIYARVTATNAGGESLASEVVGARAHPDADARVLVVGGFDRLDGAMVLTDDLSGYDIGVVQRVVLARMNDGSYTARHGAAIDAYGASFDAASAAAVAGGAVALADYDVVDWYAGEQRAPLPAAERAALEAFVAGGGKLIVSGSELAAALAAGEPDEQAFLRDVLGAALVADAAGTYAVAGAAPPFEAFAMAFDDGGPGGYDAEAADVLAPSGAGTVVLRYGVDGAPAAGVLVADAALVLGFPFETVAGADARAELMARALAHFAVEPDPVLGPDAGPGDPEGLAGSCGCRASSPPASLAWLVLLAALALMRSRRRGDSLRGHVDRRSR